MLHADLFCRGVILKGLMDFEPGAPELVISQDAGPRIEIINGHKFYVHTVQRDDDVTSLAMHYGTLPSVIKQHNPRARCFNHLDHMIGEKLYIPVDLNNLVTVRAPSEEKKRREHFAIMAFIQSASAKEKVPEAVARYYLQEHGWNVDAALKAFNDDVNWENSEEGKRARDAVAFASLSLSMPVPSAPPREEQEVERAQAPGSVLNRRKVAQYPVDSAGEEGASLRPLVR